MNGKKKGILAGIAAVVIAAAGVILRWIKTRK